jgi:hypothetical protein
VERVKAALAENNNTYVHIDANVLPAKSVSEDHLKDHFRAFKPAKVGYSPSLDLICALMINARSCITTKGGTSSSATTSLQPMRKSSTTRLSKDTVWSSTSEPPQLAKRRMMVRLRRPRRRSKLPAIGNS